MAGISIQLDRIEMHLMVHESQGNPVNPNAFLSAPVCRVAPGPPDLKVYGKVS